jgi:ubiquinone/menaquinone biosynthesis C-methylase UbiE
VFHPKGPTLLELLQQALTSTERGYDLLAPKFDYTPFRTPEPIVREIARAVGPVPAALDVCCGTGAALRALADVGVTRAVGIDSSVGMLEEASKHVPTRVELVRGDALDMPFREAFNAAVCVGAFGHIAEEDEPRFVSSIWRALKPGGRFVFATTELPSWRTTGRIVAEAFNAAMHVRNALLSPPFIMYYLTFLWPAVRARLIAAGFDDVHVVRDAFPSPYERVLMVIATRPVSDARARASDITRSSGSG